jgi:hypothetical protein
LGGHMHEPPGGPVGNGVGRVRERTPTPYKGRVEPEKGTLAAVTPPDKAPQPQHGSGRLDTTASHAISHPDEGRDS